MTPKETASLGFNILPIYNPTSPPKRQVTTLSKEKLAANGSGNGSGKGATRPSNIENLKL